MDNMDGINRFELASMALRLVMLGAFSYYSLKFMMNAMDPTKKQKKDAQKRAQVLFDRLNLSNVQQLKLNEYELVVASQLIDPQSIDISWHNIGGLDSVINDIKSEVILPMRMPHIFQSSRSHRPPTGVLLHGPPGCGKTMLAKATAREAGARFINLEVAMLTDKWYGESQKLAKAVFTLAKKIQPCIIFIDEIDSFLRSRDSHDHEATAMVKAQFMTLWDGLETDADCQVIIMGATNRPRDVDRAILRRMPAMYSIGLPNALKRKEILVAMVEPGSLDRDVNLEKVAELTEDFSGSDLREMYRAAAMIRVKEYAHDHPELFDFINNPSASASTTSSNENYSLINDGSNGDSNGDSNSSNLRSIRMNDFVKVINKMIESRGLLGIGNGQSVIGID